MHTNHIGLRHLWIKVHYMRQVMFQKKEEEKANKNKPHLACNVEGNPLRTFLLHLQHVYNFPVYLINYFVQNILFSFLLTTT